MRLSNKVEMDTNGLLVPDNVTIPFIEGDGIGKDIWKASSAVISSAVEKAYKGSKNIEWLDDYRF